ncbi:hypothetical protein [Mesorhizobium sp. M5C.F.Ca.IN.020.32.2.1]|uniref:hypothetical protein n=1 Tax=Mesorhizobium sp. M5C.F.Ca.IN.020.32.2.1 TaxID=2496771 RepID=UPI0013E294EA|nr:hypothetical protein [Mesorhizobium sp. M5C.F.Ca.IN.020.32.2.1]
MFRSPVVGILADLYQTARCGKPTTLPGHPVRATLFAATQIGEPAPRYQAA